MTSQPHRSHRLLPGIAHSLHWPLMISLSGVTLLTLTFMGIWVWLFTSQTEERVWQSRQEDAAQNLLRAVQGFLQYEKDGLALVGALDAANPGIAPETLRAMLSRREDWLEIMRLDAAGHVVASAARDEALLAGPFTETPNWIAETLHGRETTSGLLVSPGGEPYLLLSIPASGGGAVAARLRPDSLWELVQNYHFSSSGHSYLASLDGGRLIAYSGQARVQSLAAAVTLPYYQPIRAGASEWSGSYTSLEGEAVLGRADRIPSTGWILVTEYNRSESARLQRFALVVFCAGLLALWGLTVITTNRFLARMISQPIENLRQGAEIVGQGNLQHRVPVTRDDEIGKVTAAFNRMSENLAENEQRMRFACEQALEASRFKSEILNNVSHELRTPMGVILGFAEMLRDGVYGFIADEQRAPLNDIIRSVHVLSGIVNNLIDQAKLSSHQVQLKRKAFRLEELLQPVMESAVREAEKKGLALETVIDPGLPPLLCGDPARLRQILSNLVGNAVKFTGSGKVSVRLFQPGPDHWAMQVEDTGCGITPKAQQTIFEPFRQVDGSTTRAQNGTGLGLAIVQQLANLMDGEILLESTPGQGSTFTVLFPLLLSEAEKV